MGMVMVEELPRFGNLDAIVDAIGDVDAIGNVDAIGVVDGSLPTELFKPLSLFIRLFM